MHDPEILSHARFTENLNTIFQVRPAESNIVDLELIEVSVLRDSARQERFSIVFRGPLDRFLPQDSYELSQDSIGRFDLLIVPVGKDEAGFLYEAVFNRLKPEPGE